MQEDRPKVACTWGQYWELEAHGSCLGGGFKKGKSYRLSSVNGCHVLEYLLRLHNRVILLGFLMKGLGHILLNLRPNYKAIALN